jgi:diphthamide synthase subunit DPH2
MIEKCWNLSDFIQLWFSRLPYYKTYEDAYESIEIEFEKKFKRRRYKNYETFRKAKDRYFKIVNNSD